MLVFITTFVSPHTLPLGLEMTKYYDRVVFINTMELTEERKRMGYALSDDRVEIINLYECEGKCRELIDNARDVIMAGTRFDLVDSRIKQGKQVFIAHERIFKKGALKWLDPRTWQLLKFCHAVRRKNVYLLSIGDFAAQDFRKLGFNKDKIFRFGYFPKNESCSDGVSKRDCNQKCRVLWVGRMVDFKRPLMALKAFKGLPSTEFSLTMVGDGALFSAVKKYADKNRIDVEILGNQPNATVRELMYKSDILFSTSNRGEGWAAVVNEGMSCGCAVVCSDSIGCAGTLANDKNSVIFDTHSVKDAKRALVEARDRRDELGALGKLTVENDYCAATAAERFSALAKADNKDIFADGVCSKVY